MPIFKYRRKRSVFLERYDLHSNRLQVCGTLFETIFERRHGVLVYVKLSNGLLGFKPSYRTANSPLSTRHYYANHDDASRPDPSCRRSQRSLREFPFLRSPPPSDRTSSKLRQPILFLFENFALFTEFVFAYRGLGRIRITRRTVRPIEHVIDRRSGTRRRFRVARGMPLSFHFLARPTDRHFSRRFHAQSPGPTTRGGPESATKGGVAILAHEETNRCLLLFLF